MSLFFGGMEPQKGEDEAHFLGVVPSWEVSFLGGTRWNHFLGA